MANVLCQIRGHKRLLLFPPSDVQHFHFSPGASSSGIDVFSRLNKDVELARTHPHEAVLSPGDVLFLPALWLHTASPTDGVSVAVNVFFRNLESGYAPGKDVYGNRDLQAYEKGRQDVARIAKSFSKLPRDARHFYLLRLGEELKNMVDS
jgi:tRNA wybutosine-synthesizing protein 4